MTPSLELPGRTALIIGGGAGVGRSVAEVLGAAGARVVVCDSDHEAARAEVDELVYEGIDAQWIKADPGCYHEIRSVVPDLGVVDICVVDACARDPQSPDRRREFVDSDPSEWRYDGTAFAAVANVWRTVLPRMISNNWGRLVAVAPDAMRSGCPGAAMESAHGAAAGGLARSLALEVGRYGVTANCVAVGPIAGHECPISDGTSARPDFALPRLGRTDDVAGLVAYLVSPTASWITGQTIPINGGLGPA